MKTTLINFQFASKVSFSLEIVLLILMMLVRGCRTIFCKSENLFQILAKKKFDRNVTNFLNVNTNITKDFILFKYENPKYFKYLNLFGITQFGFWMYLSSFSYTTLRDAPVSKENAGNLSWWRRINLGENKYRNTIAIFCALLGYVVLVGSWSYTLKSVRFLILRKGGNTVSFVTYTPFGKNRIMDVPLNKLSAAESRHNAKVHLPIKVQGKYLYYMLDMRGEFTNKQLFDATAGLRRKFS